MPFFALDNLTKQAVTPAVPWEFTPGPISATVRTDKSARQQWYKAPQTRHLFYTLVEAANPNQRTSKSNPPRLLHGIAADFDLPITTERANEAIASWKIKPQWIERSLGGNLRLLFLFSRPLLVDSADFAIFLLEKSIAWLALDQLPGLDRGAITDPNRLYCAGDGWLATGHPPVPENALQAFFVDAAREFRFVAPEGVEIPLEVIEAALKEKYSNFSWPGEFAVETTGPSFWIADSVSTNSAILKPEGFITFSAHAAKIFYNWADLLGAGFVKEINDAAVEKATADIFYDGRQFYRKKHGRYTGMPLIELNNHLEIDCGMKGRSIKVAQAHIYAHNNVECAAPYLFRPPGLIIYMGGRKLNTSSASVMPPAAEKQTWGGSGNFSFLSSLLDSLFTTQLQRDWLLAWWKYFYESGLHSTPAPGQAVFILGGVGTGKTFLSQELVGKSVGGFADASGHLIRGGEFTSHLFELGLWLLDDETVSDSPVAAQNLQSALKRAVANSSFLMNKKFQVAGMTAWLGRVMILSNLDYMSSRVLGPIDSSSLGKISVLRAEKVSKLKFPSRAETARLTAEQLPFLLRWLVDHEPPETIIRDVRFGIESYHEASLMDQAGQTAKAAPFKEILIDSLDRFFKDNPEETEWRGTMTKLVQLLHVNPWNEAVIRTLRLEAIARYLESIEREGILQCRAESGPFNTREWIFLKWSSEIKPPPEVVDLPAKGSIFSKTTQ